MTRKKNVPIERQCVNCGDGFISNNPRRKYCNQEKHKNCPMCGKEFSYICKSKFKSYCDGLCAAKDPKRLEKQKKTNLERHGVENSMHSPEIAKRMLDNQRENNGGKLAFNTEKQKNTMMERYGVSIPAKNEEIKARIRKTQHENNDGMFAFNTAKQQTTMNEKYGGGGRLSSKEEMKKQIEIMLERYGVRTPCEDPEILRTAIDNNITNNGFLFGNGSRVSVINKTVANKIQEKFAIEVKFEHRVDNAFFDLFLPEYNIAIDINPTVTHNSTVPFVCLRLKCDEPCNKHNAKPHSYHYQRACVAKDNNLTLIQMYDWDDIDDVISMVGAKITPMTKVSARKCEARPISQRNANAFLHKYHIQGKSSRQKHCYGMFYNDELISVATFSPSRFNKKVEWEFNRYAVHRDFIIHGGAGKLFKQFVRDIDPTSIISYVDFNHTTKQNTFLNSIGFIEDTATGPTLIWHNARKNPQKVTQTALNKLGADTILRTEYGNMSESGMNNEDIVLHEGYVKIYTAGNRVFIWRKK